MASPPDPCSVTLSDGQTNIKNIITTNDSFYMWVISQTETSSSYGNSIDRNSSEENINTAFRAITNINADLTAVKTCLTTSKPTPQTDQAKLITAIDEATKSLDTINNDIQVAQDRALLVRHPELSRSYYEGLFPIGRPMKQSSIPVLIGIAVFMFSISFFIFLNTMNIRMETVLTLPAFLTRTFEYQQFGKPFFIVLGVAIILFALTIYAFTRKA